jgi:hypothetical protein
MNLASFASNDRQGKSETTVKTTSINFSGIECDCGGVSRADFTFCFRVADFRVSEKSVVKPASSSERFGDVNDKVEKAKVVVPSTDVTVESPTTAAGGPLRATTAELLEKGNDEPVVRIRDRQHANPLRSCPVTPEDLL